MFFSLSKLLLLFFVVVGVWQTANYLRQPGSSPLGSSGGSRRTSGPTGTQALDLVKCPVCGNYVSPAGGEACGRADCPRRA